MELNKLNIEIKGEVLLGDTKIKYVEGGFGEGQKSILSSDIAKKHNVKVKHLNELISTNITRFNNNDLIDLCNENFKVVAKDLGLITSNGQKHCYLLSERGYIKLVSMMSNNNDTKWEVMDEIINEYFKMREEIKTVKMYEKKSKLVEAESILLLDEVKGSSEYDNFVNNAVRNELEKIIYKTGIPVTYFCKEANISNSHMHMFRTRVRNLTQDRLEDLISVLYRAKYL